MKAVVVAALFVFGCRNHGDDGERDVPALVGSASGSATPGARALDVVHIDPQMMRDLRVTTGRATLHAAGETVSALGELHVNEDKYAEIASPVAARIARIIAKPGDPVKTGQVLAELRSPELAQARAESAAARAHLEVATQNAERKQKLASDRLIPDRERIEAEATLSEARAAAKVAAAAMRRFGATDSDMGLLLESPLDGIVIDRTALVGQLADPSKTLFKVGDLSTLWLVAHVFERDAVRVQPGSQATATFAALPGKKYDVTLRWVAREVNPTSRTIAIRFEIDNHDGVLRPGMTATVAVPLGDATDQAICVPAAAIQRVGEGWAVFVPQGPGVFAVRAIGRGRDLGATVEVVSGLEADEEVVVGGAFLLKAEADKARGGAAEE